MLIKLLYPSPRMCPDLALGVGWHLRLRGGYLWLRRSPSRTSADRLAFDPPAPGRTPRTSALAEDLLRSRPSPRAPPPPAPSSCSSSPRSPSWPHMVHGLDQ